MFFAPQGSAYVSHPASSYDLFVTAAASDCIKLWDLRSNRCVTIDSGVWYPTGLPNYINFEKSITLCVPVSIVIQYTFHYSNISRYASIFFFFFFKHDTI